MKKDFVVATYVVHKNKVLLVKHKKLNRWLPVGGHIDEGEIPEEALMREIKEETGITDVEFFGEKDEKGNEPGVVQMLITPNHVQLEQIDKKTNHQHIDFVYFCKAKKDKINLAHKEHDEIKWFSEEELDSPEIKHNVRYFAKKAIKEAGK